MTHELGGTRPAIPPDAVHDWENEGGRNKTASTTATEPVAECMACGHSAGEHDRIALRFCDATVEGALTRGCVCRPPAPKQRSMWAEYRAAH